jgi:pilus assembly protein CpaF
MIEFHITSDNTSWHKSVSADEVRIGRHPDCDIHFDDSQVSKYHAVIRKNSDGNTYILEDLKSANGTYIDGIQVLSPVKLLPGTVFSIQKYRLYIVDSSIPGKKTDGDASESIMSHRHLRNRVIDSLDLRKISLDNIDENELRTIVQARLSDILIEEEADVSSSDCQDLIDGILNEMLGLGPIQELLDDPDVDEIMVVRKDLIYVEKNGRLTKSDKVFSSDDSVMHVIERIITPLGKRIDQSSPYVDARLVKEGHRFNAIIPPLALKGPAVTIRKFKKTAFTDEDYIRFGTATHEILDLIKLFVQARLNVIVSGGTGTGKTTFLNLLSNSIPPGERIVTIEDVSELRLQQDHVVTLQARPPNVEGVGQVTVRDLVINALRMRPDRIIVGECRGGEALDMLQAMNTGHDGSLTTGHANSPKDMLNRLETMVMMAGTQLTTQAIRQQIKSAIHVVVQLTRFSHDGSRKVTQIAEIGDIDDTTGRIETLPVVEFQRTGYDRKDRITGEWTYSGTKSFYWEKVRESVKDIPADLIRKMENS